MRNSELNKPHRILVIDDNPSIHEDIRKILRPEGSGNTALTDSKTLLFGDDRANTTLERFEIDSAFQGEDGLRMVEAAAAEGRPYSMAFVDVRMPPGWDGVETITRIWKEHSDLQVVICTAYSDYSWEDMVRRIGRSSSMVVLKKPFDNIEVLQLAHALTEKWYLGRKVQSHIRELDERVEQRTAELRAINEQLKLEIAERQQVERALVLSEERFSKAFNANPIPLAIQSMKEESITDSNKGFQDLTGYSFDELTGRTPQELNLWVEPDHAHAILERIRSERSVRHSSCQLRTKSGAVRDILLSVELIELSGHSFLLTILQDITEQLLLERQLRHSQKMEAVGQLAAGIAHDFNNMLTVIQGNASLLISDNPDPSARPMLESIVTAAQRSAKLVRQLLTFSHKQMMDVRSMNITELLASMSDMLPRMLGEHIVFNIEIPSELPPIAGDSGMIEQLLMNLAVNARDAMPGGGKLTIAAETTQITTTTVRVNQDARPGQFLCLSVSDTGEGIPADVLPRIFEPFFTTKPVGKGTGLGLATAYGIAKQHEGWIDVRSEVNVGTTFQVFIPFKSGPTVMLPADPSETLPRSRGAETVLVVEDEVTVSFCVCAILKSQGYSVLTATNGVEALAVWKENQADIDLLLTDMVMPEGISGLDLAQRLLADKPGLRVICTSGYSHEIATSKKTLPVTHRFLGKPYQSTLLLETVREVLDQPNSAPKGSEPIPS